MHAAIVIEDITKLKSHPAAELFPMFGEQEFKDLAEDIQKNGLLEPITLYDGMILDGRNRLRACQSVGVQPTFVNLNGNCPSPVTYVASKNLHRRHLTTGQRAAIAHEAESLFGKETKEKQIQHLMRGNESPLLSNESNGNESDHRTDRNNRTRRAKVGAIFHISRSSVERAAEVKERSPETFNAMKAGNVTLEDARRTIGVWKPTRPPATSKQTSRGKMGRPPQAGSPKWAADVADHYKNLRSEITRRRKENHDERKKHRWNPEDIVKRFQTELLDWIEQELDAITKTITGQVFK